MDSVLKDLEGIFSGFPIEGILRAIVVVLIAVVIQLLGSRSIRRFAKAFAKRKPTARTSQLRGASDDEMAHTLMDDRQEQRAHALGSLAHSALVLFVWGVAVITILSIFGINVAPLLASAAVVTAVIGFGAQQFIADYLAGIAMIFEDQLGIGDTVNLGGTVLGEVEETALRYTRVRDYWGTVWYVRNGTISFVQNMSQGWYYSLVEIPVPYDADLEKVQQVINDAGKDMEQDPDCNSMLLGAPYFSGLEGVTATSAIVRINTKIVPDGNQWYVSRIIRQRMKGALDDAGIHIPLDGIQVRTAPVAAEVQQKPGQPTPPGATAPAARHGDQKPPEQPAP